MKKKRDWGPGNPRNLPPELVLVPIGLKLPKWLVKKIRDHLKGQVGRGKMIEDALCEKHGWKEPDV